MLFQGQCTGLGVGWSLIMFSSLEFFKGATTDTYFFFLGRKTDGCTVPLRVMSLVNSGVPHILKLLLLLLQKQNNFSFYDIGYNTNGAIVAGLHCQAIKNKLSQDFSGYDR